MNLKGIGYLLMLWAWGGIGVMGQGKIDPIKMPERGLCAHRGCMDTHPENTLPAFKEAIRLGAQMIEFDIQFTKDSMLVVMHDQEVDRTTNGKGRVEELTFSQIRSLDAGIKKSVEFQGTKVPTFEETLAMMPTNVWLNCHLKGGAAAGARAAHIIASSGRLHQAFLTCSEEAADAAKALVPQLKICNVEGRYRKNTAIYAQESIRRAADFVQLLRPEPDEDRKASFIALRANNIKINYFYAENAQELETLWGLGADFILVNNLVDFLPEAKRLGVLPVVPLFRSAGGKPNADR
ncbi:glycerophosphodiester phosphodiesterase [Dyadobacter tibetensis]|uniref:glycerophosphodiester phosphodiesterase n=1 Tax=Dyadobacter tibetensis TaxID=1211851 RepID=UPI00046E7810|nr:glycerophosphodiester phosphodiesterase family protein [Dyadobacter tibetensis]